MKINKVILNNFKRFDDLTIDLGPNPKKIIALVGPNGCGKSSVFDAFEEKQKEYKGANLNEQPSFFSKLWHASDPSLKSQIYNRSEAITLARMDAPHGHGRGIRNCIGSGSSKMWVTARA